MKKIQTLMMAAAIFSFSWILSAGEKLDIKGSFGSKLKSGLPEGWLPNKPGFWDNEATITLNKIPDTEKNALQVTSQTKAIQIWFSKKWTISAGDKCIIKAMVKGKGRVGLGLYYYPYECGISKAFNPWKEFQATEEWTEYSVEILIPEGSPGISEIAVAIMVKPGASIEFADVAAEIEKKQQK